MKCPSEGTSAKFQWPPQANSGREPREKVTILRKKFSAVVALSFPSFKCEFWFPNFDLKLTCNRCRNSTVTTGLSSCNDRMTVIGAVARKGSEKRYIIAKGLVSTLAQRQSCHELLRDSGVAEAKSPPARGALNFLDSRRGRSGCDGT